MAPPKRKTRGWLEKERIIEPRYSHRPFRKRPDIPRPARAYEPLDVQELVYGLLSTQKHNQGAGRRRRFYERMRKYQERREPSYDSPGVRESTESVMDSEYTTGSGGTSTENLSERMDVANSSVEGTSENSSVSNITVESMELANSIDTARAMFKKKSFVQIVNNYIRAGIEEGKRQAKKYIRKALSLGVRSGYLIPSDPKGQVIHVSPNLIESSRADTKSRNRRGRKRKGEETLRVIHRRDLRNKPLTRKTKSKPPPDSAVPKKKRRNSPARSPKIKRKPSKTPKKNVADLVRERKTRSSSSNKKARENVNAPRGRPRHKTGGLESANEGAARKSIRESRRARSRSVHEEDNREKSRQGPEFRDGARSKSRGNETNQRIVTERLRSPSRRQTDLPMEDRDSPRDTAGEKNSDKVMEEANYGNDESRTIMNTG